MSSKNTRDYKLSDSFALFVGDAFVSCQNGNSEELIAPFRFNKNLRASDVRQELDIYRSLIEYIASQSEREYCFRPAENGFDVVFPLPDGVNALEFLFGMVEEVKKSGKGVKESFITGVFEGRGYIDAGKKISSIVVDLPEDSNLENMVFDCITQVGKSIGYGFRDKNPKRTRAGVDRKAQLRLKASSARKYLSELGFYSPRSIMKALEIDEFSKRVARKKSDSPVSPIVLIEDAVSGVTIGELLEQMVQNAQLAEIAEEANYLDLVSCIDQSGGFAEVEDVPKPRVQKLNAPSGGTFYPRNADVAVRALKAAEHKCERVGCVRKLFTREKDGMPYLEPHHLIPLARNDDFEKTLDVEANVVALCSSCHNEIHYGKFRRELIREMYGNRIERLEKAGIELSLEQLLEYYAAHER